MKWIKWVLVVITSAILGVAVMQYLVCPIDAMGFYAALCLLSLAGWVLVFVSLFQGKVRFLALVWTLGIFLTAFEISNTFFLNQEIDHALPELTRTVTDVSGGHTAVVYFTHGEPINYSPNAWIETIRHLDADGVPFVPQFFRPFFFNGVRSEYLEAGGSSHNQIHAQMLDSLSLLMHSENDSDLHFYLSFLDTDPRPDAAVIEALNDGAASIVIAPVFLTISSHTAEGFHLVNEINLASFGVDLCIAEPMWHSEALREMFVARVNSYLGGTPKEKVGVMLIGHGQPEAWDAIYPTQTEQEDQFRIAVKNLLVEDGYLAENILLAWMDFKSPTIEEGTKELNSKGIEKLMLIPAPISADSIHTDIEIPHAIESAKLSEDLEINFLSAWNDDPLVIEGIQENILNCLP